MSVSPFAAPGKSRPGRVRPALAPLLAMPLAMNAADPPGRIALQRWLAATLRSIFRLPCSAHGRQACRLSAIILSRLISAANYPNSRSRRGQRVGEWTAAFTSWPRFVVRHSVSLPQLCRGSYLCGDGRAPPALPASTNPEARATALRSSTVLTCSSLPRRADSPCSLRMLRHEIAWHRRPCGQASAAVRYCREGGRAQSTAGERVKQGRDRTIRGWCEIVDGISDHSTSSSARASSAGAIATHDGNANGLIMLNGGKPWPD